MLNLIILIIVLIIFCIVTFGGYEGYNNTSNEQLVPLFDKYLQDTQKNWNYVLPTDLNKMDKSDLFILDIRRPEDYRRGHIKGATNIFWLDLMKPENLKKLPKDKQIIIVCYVGHTSSQIMTLLRLLGYNAKALKFGMGRSPEASVPVKGWLDYKYDVSTE